MTSRTSPDLRSGQAGFTLIEVLVVLAVLGLMLGLVVARGPQRSPALDLRVAAGQVAGVLRAARARAIAGNRPVLVEIDVAARSIRPGGAAPIVLPADVALAATTTAGLAAGDHSAGFRFAPDGSASGGSVDLAAGERRARIDIGWLTGRVSVANAP